MHTIPANLPFLKSLFCAAISDRGAGGLGGFYDFRWKSILTIAAVARLWVLDLRVPATGHSAHICRIRAVNSDWRRKSDTFLTPFESTLNRKYQKVAKQIFLFSEIHLCLLLIGMNITSPIYKIMLKMPSNFDSLLASIGSHRQ
jgi:hypothetical protein